MTRFQKVPIHLGLIVLSGWGLVLSRSVAAGPRYTVTDLGDLGYGYSEAYDLNDSGQVVGVSWVADWVDHAFLWDRENGMQDLGTLGGKESRAGILNASGQIVGDAETADGFEHAFLWDPTTRKMQDLGTLGGDWSRVSGLNDSGQVVGWAETADGFDHAFQWDRDHGMRDLGTFGGDRSQAYALNASGQVVGWADLSSEPWIYRAFLWDPATSKMRDLGTLGGDWSVAWALNNSGQVVGHAGTADGFYHAFLWEAAHGMRDLGTLGGEHSEAYLINDSGQVVGVAETTEGTFHAFLWDRKHGMQDLGTLSGYESVASHLNASGQVVGGSYDAGGHAHAFLWERDRGIQDLNDLIPSDSGWELIWAYDISDSGAIVGCGYTGYGQIHAFLATPMDVGCILGKVTDKATGKPLAEVHVAVYNSADDLVDIVVTNRRGKFLLDLPVDTYRLVFLKKGYKQFTTVAEVQAGRTTRVNVKLRKEKIVSAIAWIVPPVPKMTVGECQTVRWRAATAGEEVTGTALVCSARGDPTVQADATLAGVEVAPGEYKATISGVSPGRWHYAAVAEVDGDSVATKPVAVIVK